MATTCVAVTMQYSLSNRTGADGQRASNPTMLDPWEETCIQDGCTFLSCGCARCYRVSAAMLGHAGHRSSKPTRLLVPAMAGLALLLRKARDMSTVQRSAPLARGLHATSVWAMGGGHWLSEPYIYVSISQGIGSCCRCLPPVRLSLPLVSLRRFSGHPAVSIDAPR